MKKRNVVKSMLAGLMVLALLVSVSGMPQYLGKKGAPVYEINKPIDEVEPILIW